ncbi:hypothetical protein Tco_1200247 [Tanacetum coccineum]
MQFQSISFIRSQASVRDSVFMLRESSDFSEESVKKSWGKETANESGLKFIPCFDSSFVEFVQPYSEEFMDVFMRIGFGSTIELVSFDKKCIDSELGLGVIIIQELGESTTTISSQLSSQQSQDKGKGIFIVPVKPMKKKDLIRLNEEVALKLQAKFDEEERPAREKAEKKKKPILH